MANTMNDPEGIIETLHRENEGLAFRLADIERNVRERETPQHPIPWADRPDIRWCVACDQYHREDHSHG